MKFVAKVLILSLVASSAYAGFGRAGSSGGFRSSSFSSARSYSAPRYSAPTRSYSSYSAPQRTVVREYHTNTVHSAPSSGGGIHPLVAGMAGYMVGDAMNRNHGSSAPAQPQVVYVNGQPQQVAQAAPQQAQQPQQDVQYAQPMPVVQQAESHAESHGVAYFFTFLFIVFGLGIAYHLGKRN